MTKRGVGGALKKHTSDQNNVTFQSAINQKSHFSDFKEKWLLAKPSAWLECAKYENEKSYLVTSC